MGAVLREQNALPQPTWFTKCLTAKDGIGNAGAGRAAKGENPLLCANEKNTPRGCFYFVTLSFFIAFYFSLLYNMVA